MLAVPPKHSLNLIWAEANNAVDLDGIDNAGLSPACEGLDADAEELSNLGRGEERSLEIHIKPSPLFTLYRVLSFGLNLSFRKLLKVPGEQPKYTAALSSGISFSFKKALSLFLMSFISIYMKFILRYLICKAISLIYLIFLLPQIN